MLHGRGELMAGAVTSVVEGNCEGWVTIEGDAEFPATVHLVVGDQIVASTIADRQGYFNDSEALSYGHFALELKGPALKSPSDASILVGETGETFPLRSGSQKPLRSARERTFFSYRDSLGIGFRREDVVAGFYLDILRRPVDPNGLANFFAEHSNCTDLDRLRRSLFESEEYARRHKRVSEGAGRLFGRQLLLRTSGRAVAFEHVLNLFLVSGQTFAGKIIRFFPALVLRAAALAELFDDFHAGVPERELFFGALAALADRPSLLVEPSFFLAMSERAIGAASRAPSIGDGSVTCHSPHFVSGWHVMEHGMPGRWMAQIGIVMNPDPQRMLDRIVATVEGEYGPVGNVFAFTQSAALEARFVDRGHDKSLVITAGGGGAFSAEYLLLLTEDATCPWCFTKQPDDRQICLNVSTVDFHRAGASS